jgi:hypothetical protein
VGSTVIIATRGDIPQPQTVRIAMVCPIPSQSIVNSEIAWSVMEMRTG